MSQKYSKEWLASHAHLGPSIIGEEAAALVTSHTKKTGGSVFGPAIVGDDSDDTKEAVKVEKKGAIASKVRDAVANQKAKAKEAVKVEK